jgi:hypothetical protein
LTLMKNHCNSLIKKVNLSKNHLFLRKKFPPKFLSSSSWFKCHVKSSEERMEKQVRQRKEEDSWLKPTIISFSYKKYRMSLQFSSWLVFDLQAFWMQWVRQKLF